MNVMTRTRRTGASDGARLDQIQSAFRGVEEAYRSLYPLLPRNSFRGSLNRAFRQMKWAVGNGRILEDADSNQHEEFEDGRNASVDRSPRTL